VQELALTPSRSIDCLYQWRNIMFKNNLIVAGAKGWFLSLNIILALMMAVLSGCGSSTYGRLQSSQEVTQVFKNKQILSDHQYYFSGFQRIPYGIIGIGNKYSLRSNRWKPIDLNPTLLNQLIYRMEHVYSLEPRGAWILDPDGNRVGIWYSSRNQTRVKIEKGNYVVVVTPEPPDLRGIP
jgi:hypothetical protein